MRERGEAKDDGKVERNKQRRSIKGKGQLEVIDGRQRTKESRTKRRKTGG